MGKTNLTYLLSKLSYTYKRLSEKLSLRSSSKKHRRIISICVIHAIWLLLLNWAWLNAGLFIDKEASIARWLSITKNVIFKWQEKPDPDSIYFINVAWDKALLNYPEIGGYKIITDRQKLIKLFHVLSQHPNEYKMILCDIYFGDTTSYDHSLESLMAKTPRLFIPSHADEAPPVFRTAQTGIADYHTLDDNFWQFPLFFQQHKTLPTIMYEQLNGGNLVQQSGMWLDQGKLSFTELLLELKVRRYDLFEAQTYTVNTLGNIISLPDESMLFSFLKGKTIVIGDLENDVHATIYEKNTPGSLILLNTYWELVEGKHLVSWTWIIFLILSYSIVSYIALFTGKKSFFSQTRQLLHHQWAVSLSKRMPVATFHILLRFFLFIKNYLSIGVFLFFICVISFFVFDRYTNILFLTIYLTITAATIHYYHDRKRIITKLQRMRIKRKRLSTSVIKS